MACSVEMIESHVVVAEYSAEPEAELARAVLESAGIEAAVTGSSVLGSGFTLGGQPGIRLWVLESQVEQAREVLESRHGSAREPLRSATPCPRCGNDSVLRERLSRRESKLRSIARWTIVPYILRPLVAADPRHRCEGCGFRW
jgi:predicted RNA-binding Zn-ribbon protein involved in translation (DUF1610 family)